MKYFSKIVLNRIFVLSLPIWFLILAHLAVWAHFKNFCLVKLIFHHECWGCGLTRAVVALSHFNFKEAFTLNPFVFLIVPMLFILWAVLIKDAFKNSQ